MVVGVSDDVGMLVRAGRMYDLGRVLDERVPVFPGRYFRQTLVTTAHHGNGGGVGSNRVNWITEIVSGTQQLGTHLDALSHLQIGDRGYGGYSVSELAGDTGVRQLGVETVPTSAEPLQSASSPWSAIGVEAPAVGRVGWGITVLMPLQSRSARPRYKIRETFDDDRSDERSAFQGKLVLTVGA